MNSKDLRIVFMGTPDFAVETLKALVENGYNIVGVVTMPDKPAGRGLKLSISAVKAYALEKGLEILQPEKLKAPEFIEQLRSLKADLQIIVAFRMLPEAVWNMPPMGSINLHGSLLPHYRGAAPLNWAVMNGDPETGATTFLLQHEIDTGNMIFQERIPIGENDTVEVVHDRMMVMGAGLVLKTVDAIASGDFPQIPQSGLLPEGVQAKTAPKIFKDDCRINWQRDGKSLFNFVRGLSPYPAAWTEIQHKQTGEIRSLKVFMTTFTASPHKESIGSIANSTNSEFKVAVCDGWIHITDLQLSGKKRLGTSEFLRGFDLSQWKLL